MHIESALLTTIFMMAFVGGMVPINSLLFPSALNLLPHELQGSGQSMIQAIRLFIASIGTVTLSAFYTGPFLPVALILVTVFLLCSLLLWRMRSMISAVPENHIAVGH
jgi:predicted membrane-bound dolichyl-phosphate-mannose-protein mannosyltransferase